MNVNADENDIELGLEPRINIKTKVNFSICNNLKSKCCEDSNNCCLPMLKKRNNNHCKCKRLES